MRKIEMMNEVREDCEINEESNRKMIVGSHIDSQIVRYEKVQIKKKSGDIRYSRLSVNTKSLKVPTLK